MDEDSGPTASDARAADGAALSPSEMERLARFERRWWLEAQGFEPAQAARLLFVRWLRERRGLES